MLPSPRRRVEARSAWRENRVNAAAVEQLTDIFVGVVSPNLKSMRSAARWPVRSACE